MPRYVLDEQTFEQALKNIRGFERERLKSAIDESIEGGDGGVLINRTATGRLISVRSNPSVPPGMVYDLRG